MRICMAPSSPPAKRTDHLLRIPDILCANDNPPSVSNKLSNSHAWFWRWRFFDALKHVGQPYDVQIFYPQSNSHLMLSVDFRIPESIDWKVRAAAQLNSNPRPRPNSVGHRRRPSNSTNCKN